MWFLLSLVLFMVWFLSVLKLKCSFGSKFWAWFFFMVPSIIFSIHVKMMYDLFGADSLIANSFVPGVRMFMWWSTLLALWLLRMAFMECMMRDNKVRIFPEELATLRECLYRIMRATALVMLFFLVLISAIDMFEVYTWSITHDNIEKAFSWTEEESWETFWLTYDGFGWDFVLRYLSFFINDSYYTLIVYNANTSTHMVGDFLIVCRLVLIYLWLACAASVLYVYFPYLQHLNSLLKMFKMRLMETSWKKKRWYFRMFMMWCVFWKIYFLLF